MCLDTYNEWLTNVGTDAETKAELAAITDPEEIKDRFYRHLEFGTGGMRGVMGAGTNRMNRYVVRRATKGLADYLLAEYGNGARTAGVAIAFDSRRNSQDFAREAALTLCAAGIPVRLFRQLAPTPTLSFAVRELGCAAGIVITASHNPKEYNGYKVYDSTGCQLVPQYADKLTEYIDATADQFSVGVMDAAAAEEAGLLTYIGEELAEKYCAAVERQAHTLPPEVKAALSVVYSPLHGTGNIPVRRTLACQGYSVTVVPEQELPDGGFPSVRLPNPEDREALLPGIALAEKIGADIVLGTDPDCDRVGVAVRNGKSFTLLTGNQTGALLVDYVVRRRAERLTPNMCVIKTIVTNELGARIAEEHGLRIIDTLTGFKYIGEQINLIGEENFVMGYEESYGFLIGTQALDKDAVVASMLMCEMASYYKAEGLTLTDVLEGLYARYGYYLDALDSFTMQGKEGAGQIEEIMRYLRKLDTALTDDIVQLTDYLADGTGMPRSDVMKYRFSDGSWMAVRPSGTEPKVKVYYSVCEPDCDKSRADSRLEQLRSVVAGVISASS